ncbi:MAG: hypothetical protein ACRDAJ_06865 [Serratia fonticola]
MSRSEMMVWGALTQASIWGASAHPDAAYASGVWLTFALAIGVLNFFTA